jgi:hypothetical protein
MRNKGMKKFNNSLLIILLCISCTRTEDSKEATPGPQEGTVSNNPEMITDNFNIIEEMKVIDDRVRLRNEPDLHSDIIMYLQKGEIVEILDKTTELQQIDDLESYWYKVKLDTGTEGWAYGAYLKENKKRMELQYPESILPDDIKNAGIEKLTNFSELAEKLSNDQLNKISKIRIDNLIVEDFRGLDLFRKLQTLEIKNSHIENLTGVVLSSSNNWLYLLNSEIENLDGLSDIKNLFFLSLSGSHIINIQKNIFPNSLATINLSNFFQYDKILDQLPSNIEQIYLNANGIQSLSEIEFLKNKYPKLIRLFIKDNQLSLEVIRKEAEKWAPIELIWWDNT